MGHEIGDRLRDYWTTAEQLLPSFYSNTLKCDRFLHFASFTLEATEIYRQANNYDRLWKIRTIFDTLNEKRRSLHTKCEKRASMSSTQR
jgi:hypothetical protein